MKNTILFLHSSSDLYGADRSLIRTINSVAKENEIRVIVCLPYEGPLVDYLRKDGHKVIVMGLGVLRRKYFSFFGVFQFAFSFSSALVRLYVIAKHNKVNLIHTNTSAVIVGGIISKVLGIPHLWHVREIIVKPIFLRKVISIFLAKFSTKVIGVSNSTIDNLLIDSPAIKNKAVVINNGIELNKYSKGDGIAIRKNLSIPKDSIVVGMVARVSHWKGQDLFLKIAQEILPNFTNIYFISLGSPFKGQEELMEKFSLEARKLPDNHRFKIVPFSEQVSDYLESFDIFILPSTLPDPFPTTCLEAMVTSKAIIVNGHGGAVDMIDHKNCGYVVSPPNNVKNFISYTEDLIQNPEKRRKYGNAALLKLKNNYTVEIYQSKISRIFSKYLEK